MPGGKQKLTLANKLVVLFVSALLISLLAAIAEHKPPPVKKATAQQAQIIKPSESENGGATNDDTSNLPEEEPDTAADSPSQTILENPDAQCQADGVLPDPACTPGVIDTAVTQVNIHQTICVAGYSKKIRPPASVTSVLKKQSMQQYGFIDSPSNYEYDHLISLELGGAPLDSANLWPEPGASPNLKDKSENRLHQLVCSGAMSLSEAQQRIASNWTTALNGF